LSGRIAELEYFGLVWWSDDDRDLNGCEKGCWSFEVKGHPEMEVKYFLKKPQR
jgi:hypothetical protein